MVKDYLDIKKEETRCHDFMGLLFQINISQAFYFIYFLKYLFSCCFRMEPRQVFEQIEACPDEVILDTLIIQAWSYLLMRFCNFNKHLLL